MARGAELSLGMPRVVSSVKLYQVAMICALGLAARLGARPLAPARPALDAAWFHRISGLSLDLLAVGALASLDFGGRALAPSAAAAPAAALDDEAGAAASALGGAGEKLYGVCVLPPAATNTTKY